MSDRTGDDELEEIMNSFDSEMAQQDENLNESDTSANKRKLSKEELEELSKEEIAEEYDFRFGKTPDGGTQHLLPANENKTHCRVGFTDKFRISEEPGPFDPICSRCKLVALGAGGSHPGSRPKTTKFDLRQLLADEIDGVQEPESLESTREPKNSLKKSELTAILSHIEALKENQ
jgi:hypothetical protein